jgi:hypothetical protein
MPAHWKLRTVRADLGFFENPLVTFLEALSIPYIVVARLTQNVKRKVAVSLMWMVTFFGSLSQIAKATVRNSGATTINAPSTLYHSQAMPSIPSYSANPARHIRRKTPARLILESGVHRTGASILLG